MRTDNRCHCGHLNESCTREPGWQVTRQGEGLRRMMLLYADSHLSNLKGMRAGTELAAMAEDWFDANVEGGWPLPRVSRAALASGEEGQ